MHKLFFCKFTCCDSRNRSDYSCSIFFDQYNKLIFNCLSDRHMSLLDSFGDTLQNLGNNVGNKLDDLAGKVVQQAGLKKELGGLFTQAQSNAERKEATFAPLELPEFYQKAVNVLLKNETAFANVANLAEFMQALIGTKAYAVLNVIDLDANVVPTGPREDDFTMVLVGVRIIASIIKDYTPQDVNFNRPYKFGLAGDTLTVMVRQPDGSYVPLAQNTQPIPDNTSFRNLVPGIKAHMK